MVVDFVVRCVFFVWHKYLALAFKNKEELIALRAIFNYKSPLIKLSVHHVANRFLDGRISQAPVLKEGQFLANRHKAVQLHGTA